MKLLLFIVCFLAFSCANNGNSPFSSSDSLAIQFKSMASGSIVKTVSTREEKAIRKIADFIDGPSDKEFNCGYDGTMSFYKKGILVGNVSFNYSMEGCHHFLQTTDDSLKLFKMNNEAADFLRNLAGGKSWY